MQCVVFLPKVREFMKKTQGLKQTRHGVGGRRRALLATLKTRTIHPTVPPDR